MNLLIKTIFSRSMAAFFSFLIRVGMSLTSSSIDCSLLSSKPAGPLPLATVLASVVPILNVSPKSLSLLDSLVLGGSFCFTRFLNHRLLRTKLWNHGWFPCQAAPLNHRLYCHPSSSTSWLISTYQLFQSQTQPGSGTCAFVMLTGDGLNLASTQGDWSILRFHSAFEEKRGIPKTNQPRWFSYSTSTCAS